MNPWPYIPKTNGGGAKMWHLHNRCEPETIDCHRAHSETKNAFVQKLMFHPNTLASLRVPVPLRSS